MRRKLTVILKGVSYFPENLQELDGYSLVLTTTTRIVHNLALHLIIRYSSMESSFVSINYLIWRWPLLTKQGKNSNKIFSNLPNIILELKVPPSTKILPFNVMLWFCSFTFRIKEFDETINEGQLDILQIRKLCFAGIVKIMIL